MLRPTGMFADSGTMASLDLTRMGEAGRKGAFMGVLVASTHLLSRRITSWDAGPLLQEHLITQMKVGLGILPVI